MQILEPYFSRFYFEIGLEWSPGLYINHHPPPPDNTKNSPNDFDEQIDLGTKDLKYVRI